MNVKFLFCNTMYMVNTAMDMFGILAHSDQANDTTREQRMTHFVYSLYLTGERERGGERDREGKYNR